MIVPAAPCPRCLELERRVAELQATVAQLQARIARLTQENAALRQRLQEQEAASNRQTAKFRRRHLKQRRKKSGRRKGHPAANRPTPAPERIDRVLHVPCRACPDCHVPLVDPALVVQYQTDLPPIVPFVTQFNIETGYCPCCRQYCQGRHPEQISNAIGAAGNTFGPVILSMAAELKHRLGVPYRKICDFFTTYCNLEICPATLVRAERRLTELARPTYDLLIEALRQADVVHADETGWRIHTVNAWLWVFTNANVTVYAIRHSRGHEVPLEILGPDFDGYLVVDGLASYTVLDYKKGQCNGHLLRRAKHLSDTAPSQEQPYVDQLIELLQDAIALAGRRPELTPETFHRRAGDMEDRLILWLNHLPPNPSAELQRLANHVLNHVDEWLVFLYHPEVPPTNNHAERMLRPAVITRKIGGCNKNLLGALVHSVLGSILATCHQQGRRFLQLARQLWSAGEPRAIPLVPPTS